jgi:hypothetical protein
MAVMSSSAMDEASALIASVAAGDETAFASIVRLYHEDMPLTANNAWSPPTIPGRAARRLRLWSEGSRPRLAPAETKLAGLVPARATRLIEWDEDGQAGPVRPDRAQTT